MIPRIAAHWREVADQLGYELHMIQVFEQRWRDPILCCQDLMRDWLNTDTGVGPKTWDTLLLGLKKIRHLKALVEEIENDLLSLV